VGILTIPLVASVSEDAMRSVPAALREASYGMGARRATTSLRVVIPAAVSGLVAALIVAVLLLLLIRAVRDIEQSVDGLLEIAGKVGANTANIPQLEATAPVLAKIVDEAVVQDGYMSALTDGFGDRR
jgi:ABC-type nitrate/sulfonate/bicarbonate transport system permease component